MSSCTSSTSSTAGGAASAPQLASFKDPLLRTGSVVLHLLRAVAPGSISEDEILPGATVIECKLNAKYAISCAHKLGCRVFTTWEDIVNLKARMILCLIAGIMEQDIRAGQYTDRKDKQ